MNEGWKCPNCGAGIAPFVQLCPNCTGQTVTITGPIMTDCGCPLSLQPCQNSYCPRRPQDTHYVTIVSTADSASEVQK